MSPFISKSVFGLKNLGASGLVIETIIISIIIPKPLSEEDVTKSFLYERRIELELRSQKVAESWFYINLFKEDK